VREKGSCELVPSHRRGAAGPSGSPATSVTDLVPQSPSRGPATHRWRRGAPVAAAIGLLVLAVTGIPDASAAPQPTLSEVQAQIEQLNVKAEQVTERYDTTREQLASLKIRVDAAQTRLAEERRLIALNRAALGRLAAESYQRGPLDSLSLFLASDPDSYLESAGLVQTLAQRQVAVVQRLKSSERRMALDTAQVSSQQAAVASAVASLQADRATIVRTLALAQAQLDRLKAAQRRALERASRSGVRTLLAGAGDCASAGIKAPSARVQKVIDFACAQLGEPYQFGSDGPSSWDCSGLTMMAWAAAGVSLPHSSAMQAGYGTSVSVSELRPGDLVFYYSPIHHVAIYVGNGLVIDAPHTGAFVNIRDMRLAQITAAVRL
jgi:cell wall-associated NlpC family hydrolase